MSYLFDESQNTETYKIQLLRSISSLLQEIINEQGDNLQSKKTIFCSKTIPPISIENYLDRIIKYTKLETSTLILSLINIDKICELNSLQITKYNVHRLLQSSVVISIKINEDDSYYSKVTGVSLSEINNLEDEFLRKIRFKLWTDISLFLKYKRYLSKYIKE